VRRTFFKYWMVAILLVTRLVLGEFVHAHDGGHVAASEAAVAQESAQCHDDAKQSSEPECCNTGGCECPCLFATALAAGTTLALQVTTETRTAGRFAGAPSNQLFTLFRPPAALPRIA
jgi:hypothetical protein